MEIVRIDLGERSYPIVIAEGQLALAHVAGIAQGGGGSGGDE